VISIKDIARLAEVSPSTVSRVLNDKEYVKTAIREKVMRIVAETGYVQNHAARSMVLQRTFTVGIVIPDTFNMFQRQLFAVIEHHLEQRGYRTMFFFVTWSPESEETCLRKMRSESLDGIIMIHEVSNPAIYKFLHGYSKPVVLCTFGKEGYAFPAVHVDEIHAAETAVECLASAGHKRIGLIAGAHFRFSALRSEGYRNILKKHGIEPKESWAVTVPTCTLEAGKEGMHTLLKRKDGLTAVFAVTDELALGALRALSEAGLSVPDDVSIVGFDDIEISAFSTPSLTTIAQPIHDMGERTAVLICDLIAQGKGDKSQNVFPFRLVERESVKAGAGIGGGAVS
jgi:LacI family transcriptional regulator